jgi:hypothetical protein
MYLIFNKEAKAIQWNNMIFSAIDAGITGYSHANE